MRKHGACFEFERERNADLLSNYRRLIADTKHIDYKDIYRQLVMQPSKRFWVSEERAEYVVSAMISGKPITGMRPNKMEMFCEIYRRAVRLLNERPRRSIADVVSEVVNQEAPQFYLTPESARVILIKAKKKKRYGTL